MLYSVKIFGQNFFFGQKNFIWIRGCDIYNALFVLTKRFFLVLTLEKLDF